MRAATDGEAWVADGNYRLVREVVLARATRLVWLDYSRALVMARVLRRSFARALGGGELWPGTGNREDFRRWLDKEHPIRWAWDTHARRRVEYAAMFTDPIVAHLDKDRLTDPRQVAGLMGRLRGAG